MPKTKEKDKVPVRINYGANENPPIDVDEVFVGNEPAKYLKAGTHDYKEGAFTESTIEKKEELIEEKK